jgi:alpha-D-xyloside xylohydrolase
MQWAGDTGASWSGLAASIMGGLSWGMSGCPYYSTDIGGFYGEQPSPELFIRWTQAAVFCSHMRFHGIGPREPWAFGPEAEAIVREFIDLRYKLIPYLQKTCAQAAETGLPVMRSMALAFPGEKAPASFETQYMLGDDLFVAPVLRSGGKVAYRLPLGLWRDLWSGKPREGGTTITETMPLGRIPVYVRDSALVPFGPVVTHTGELSEKNRIAAYVAYGETALPPDGKPVMRPEKFFR